MCFNFKRDSICCISGVNKILTDMHVSRINVLFNIYATNDKMDYFAQQGCSHILTWEINAELCYQEQ